MTSIEIREALSAPVRLICEAVRGVLEEAPPELSADLVDSGITLCGGGSLLYGISEAIAETLSMRKVVSKSSISDIVLPEDVHDLLDLPKSNDLLSGKMGGALGLGGAGGGFGKGMGLGAKGGMVFQPLSMFGREIKARSWRSFSMFPAPWLRVYLV